MKFVKEGGVDTEKISKTIPALVKDYGIVAGNLKINIISGNSLKNTDLMGKSDPFCTAYLQSNPK